MKSHKDYPYDISLNAKRNPKKFWPYVASKRKCSDSNSFNINDSVISNPTEIADAFNKHFVANLIVCTILLILVLYLTHLLLIVHLLFVLIFLQLMTFLRLWRILMLLNLLGLMKSFLKPCCNELAPILCDLFNFFVQKGKVPMAWKWVFCLIIPGLDPVPVPITMAWNPYPYPYPWSVPTLQNLLVGDNNPPDNPFLT